VNEVTPQTLDLLRVERRYGVATVGQVLVAVWEDESIPTMAMFEDLLELIRKLRRESLARELITLCIVAERAVVPEPALRRIGAQGFLLSDLFVVVHEGSGFRATMVRALFTTGVLAMSAKANLQITADVDEASALIARCACSAPVKASVLASNVRELRERMRAA
jgi:hypothetical protein